MAKDRIADTIVFLKNQANGGQLTNIKENDISIFKSLVEKVDKTNQGAVLSLNWSRYNTRPAKELRHAIRAHLLTSIYTGDIAANAVATEASRVKNNTAQWFNKETSKRLQKILGLNDPKNTHSVQYLLKSAGHDANRAEPVCSRIKYPILTLMDIMSGEVKPAIVLIDMQATGDIGQNRHYGGVTVLDHQKAILKKAGDLGWIIYDIVVDPVGAAEWGNSYKVSDSEQKQEIIERQRRASYQASAGIKTNGILSDQFGGARVRHIPKPTHPAFIGTLFAEHLEQDGVNLVIVMGYDANVCIKATVFGVPSETLEEAERQPTGQEVEAIMKKFPALSLKEAEKRATPTKSVLYPYTKGLLDRNIEVITSRSILASSSKPLESEWNILSGFH
ncbi:MAG: nicotinamidase-related amidase [Oleiphilaceae bacterium]|jgi:nicotinamidase-related amidase